MSLPIPQKYVADFEKLGFGMFVHFGLYSQIGMGEWFFHHANQKMDDYKKLAQTFTAEDFDAEKLVLTAKNAGCKYINLTTRHHEGFSLYDTCGLSEFDVIHTPAGRDLVKEFVESCNKHDIVPFFYHTYLDWYNPDYKNDFDAYLEYLRKSVEILCTNYGKIGGIWFDGKWDKPDADWKEDELYSMIRRYQPEAIIVNNTGLEHRGELGNPEIDSVTFERGRPTPMDREGMSKYIAAEMCDTMNNQWGIGYMDFDYKSPGMLIENLVNCRKVGANYLLNIGPGPQGGIESFQGELLNLIGKWMSLYGDAIYNGKPYQAHGMGNNFILKGENELYLFFLDMGNNGNSNVTIGGKFRGWYSFGNVADKVESITWMDTGDEVDFVQGRDVLSVNVTGYPYGMSTCVRVARAKIV